MILIILLCGLAVEYFVQVPVNMRRLAWFAHYADWLKNKFAGLKYWDGIIGVIITLAIPLLLLLLIDYGLSTLFYPLSYLFGLLILFISLGPVPFNQSLISYIHALENKDNKQAKACAAEFCHSRKAPDPTKHEQEIIENLFIQANERVYGVIFWFIILGPLGAAMYRLTNILKYRYQEIHGAYEEDIRHLSDILNWPATRLFTLGNALAGHMIGVMLTWRQHEKPSLKVNETVLTNTSLAALQYTQDSDHTDTDMSYWIREAQGLMNRTLIIWLTILGLMVISGMLA